MLRRLEIQGLRGFATLEALTLAVPNNTAGSGLTTIVGANNSGKSTIIEAFRALSVNQTVSFTRGQRNGVAGDSVKISLIGDGLAISVYSMTPGSSETGRNQNADPEIFLVPSRRAFNPYFGRSDADRRTYGNQLGLSALRTSAIDQFSGRMFRANSERSRFNAVLQRVLDPVPDWTIDREDSGNYFIKIKTLNATHSSEGMGEGLVSLLFIVDALYDSPSGSMIVIDEPELSLHPALQKRLCALLMEYARDRQIVIATHSPYFTNLASLTTGGTLARVYLDSTGSRVAQLSQQAIDGLRGLTADDHNPHTLGLDAREVFFLEDGVVLFEGQEDVLFAQRALASVGRTLDGQFFGWGVGGAEKMTLVAAMLHDLGFMRVVGLLDSDKLDVASELTRKFPLYHFATIPAADIRTKQATEGKPAKKGLLDDANAVVRPEYALRFQSIVDAANVYLTSQTPT